MVKSLKSGRGGKSGARNICLSLMKKAKVFLGALISDLTFIFIVQDCITGQPLATREPGKENIQLGTLRPAPNGGCVSKRERALGIG